MSILIKGMEMPINCETCPFDDGTYCQAYPKSAEMIYDIANGIPTWCPLIEIPPHGRLIDADALAQAANEFPFGYRGMILAEIAVAPTIIEAEEGENG